jgi:hypothetical protein
MKKFADWAVLPKGAGVFKLKSYWLKRDIGIPGSYHKRLSESHK